MMCTWFEYVNIFFVRLNNCIVKEYIVENIKPKSQPFSLLSSANAERRSQRGRKNVGEVPETKLCWLQDLADLSLNPPKRNVIKDLLT